ncbi:MAG TPA: hypothetical protein VKZ42_05900 [Flavobacteriaceae bacterium]|nr:hypothetical protein [Flavobacteriaceae bacterium]
MRKTSRAALAAFWAAVLVSTAIVFILLQIRVFRLPSEIQMVFELFLFLFLNPSITRDVPFFRGEIA